MFFFRGLHSWSDAVLVAKADAIAKAVPVAKARAIPDAKKDCNVPKKKSIATDKNTVISGIIGTDKEGNTYSPQSFTFVYS